MYKISLSGEYRNLQDGLIGGGALHYDRVEKTGLLNRIENWRELSTNRILTVINIRYSFISPIL
jgi:hypothetical protein